MMPCSVVRLNQHCNRTKKVGRVLIARYVMHHGTSSQYCTSNSYSNRQLDVEVHIIVLKTEHPNVQDVWGLENAFTWLTFHGKYILSLIRDSSTEWGKIQQLAPFNVKLTKMNFLGYCAIKGWPKTAFNHYFLVKSSLPITWITGID